MRLRFPAQAPRRLAALALATLLLPAPGWSQNRDSRQGLPDAPQAALLQPKQTPPVAPPPPPMPVTQAPPPPAPTAPNPASPAPPNGGNAGQGTMIPSVNTPPGPRLTRSEAERMAIAHNPHISVSRLVALAQHQVVREVRSAEYPQLEGSITAEQAYEASRIASGELNSSRLFTKAGGGVNFSQLITDFGRTVNLVGSAKLREDEQKANALATEEDIVLATDQAFYNALQAQALLNVAVQTVNTRQTTQGQINQLTKNNLRSTLDLSIANVNLSQSQLLQLDAQSNADATMAALDEVLGLDHPVNYTLVDDTENPPPPADEATLQAAALKQRPDLQALVYDQQAETRYSHAERDQLFPVLTAIGTAGTTPIRDPRYYTSAFDGAIGVNLDISIFNGFLYTAQAREAQLRAQASGEQARVLRDRIVRDVHTAWLQAITSFQRIGVSQQLLNQANMSLALAQTRYQLGLSSIVELSQAQLQQTQAAISYTNSEYQYRLSLAALNFQTGAAP